MGAEVRHIPNHNVHLSRRLSRFRKVPTALSSLKHQPSPVGDRPLRSFADTPRVAAPLRLTRPIRKCSVSMHESLNSSSPAPIDLPRLVSEPAGRTPAYLSRIRQSVGPAALFLVANRIMFSKGACLLQLSGNLPGSLLPHTGKVKSPFHKRLSSFSHCHYPILCSSWRHHRCHN